MRNEEKTYDLCKAFLDMKQEGVEEGRKEGIKEGIKEGSWERLINTVCIKLRKSKQAEVIADELEEELSEIERIIEAQRQVGSYDVKQISKVLAEQNV